MSQTNSTSSSTDARESPEPLISAIVELNDHSGRPRRGRAVLLPSWPANPADQRPAEDEDFRIVILAEPPEGPISPPAGVVVSAPVRCLASRLVRAGEPAPTYTVSERSDLSLTSRDIGLLKQDDLFAATSLQVTAEDVFADGKAQPKVLARDLLATEGFVEQTIPIAIALAALNGARPPGRERLEELGELIGAVSKLSDLGEDDSEPKRAVGHLSELVYAADPPEFLALSERIYPDKKA